MRVNSMGLKNNFKHGLTKTREFKIWSKIKYRCFNKNSDAYKNYGGRGISMYENWIHDPKSFIEYIKTLENYNVDGLTLDRINNDGNYEPGNLKYSTKSEQAFNRRSWAKMEEYKDRIKVKRKSLKP